MNNIRIWIVGLQQFQGSEYEDPNAIYNAVLHSSRNPFDSSGKLSLTIPTWFASEMLLQSLFNFNEIA